MDPALRRSPPDLSSYTVWNGEVDEDGFAMGMFDTEQVEWIRVSSGLIILPQLTILALENLKGIMLPSSLQEIEMECFSHCDELIWVQCDNVTTSQLQKIGTSAWEGATALQTMFWPVSLREIGDSAFSRCESLQTLELPVGSQLKIVGDNAFHACDSLEHVNLSHATLVRYLGTGAFQQCAKLATVQLPPGLQSLGAHVFTGCRQLRAIVLPSTLVSIGDWAFFNCRHVFGDTGLLTLPSSLKHVGRFAFHNCRQLHHVQLGVNRILSRHIMADHVFVGCSSLAKLELTEPVPLPIWPHLLHNWTKGQGGTLHRLGIEHPKSCVFYFLTENMDQLF